MGRLNTNQTSPTLKHFSHPHDLNLSVLSNQTSLCSACKLPCSGDVYSCTPCNFNLHSSCTKYPPLITHPSHAAHPLALLPTSSYPGGVFNCDACHCSGNGFSYHCRDCNYDVHILCAARPLRVTTRAHSCPLHLTFSTPYDGKGFSCDVCRRMGRSEWLYRCPSCEFDVHLECAEGGQAPIQHQHSFPGAQAVGVRSNQYLIHHSASMPVMAQNQFPGAVAPRPVQYAQAQPPVGNGLMNSVVQGFVEGAAQQVGQTVMQGFMGGGNGGGDGSMAGGDFFGGSSEAESYAA